jgi:hypothetical protein
MNWAWWDGKMSFEHYREEHALDAATLLEATREEHPESPEEEHGNGATPAAKSEDAPDGTERTTANTHN